MRDRVHDQLRGRVRAVVAGKEPTPSAAGIDSRSVKTTQTGGDTGITPGLVIAVLVHAASVRDRDGAERLMARMVGGFGRLKLVRADGGYAGQRVGWSAGSGGWRPETVKRVDDLKGFELLPHWWGGGRTFAWLGRYRRHNKDYEYLTASGEATVEISMINLILHRLSLG